jgi:tRNA1(Val) A37 N6-methylase TrmN6
LNHREITADSPAEGVVIYQPRAGFRYAMDPILLVGWAMEGGTARTFIDIGTGSGVMALLLTRLGLTGLGIDVLPEWIELATRSGRKSGIDARFECIDARSFDGVSADLVVCNPPYFPLSTGTVSPDPLRASGRHECAGTLAEITAAACRAGARVCMTLPESRRTEAEAYLAAGGRPVSRRLLLDEGFSLIEGRQEPGDVVTERGSLRGDGGHGPLAYRLFALAGADLVGIDRGKS